VHEAYAYSLRLMWYDHMIPWVQDQPEQIRTCSKTIREKKRRKNFIPFPNCNSRYTPGQTSPITFVNVFMLITCRVPDLVSHLLSGYFHKYCLEIFSYLFRNQVSDCSPGWSTTNAYTSQRLAYRHLPTCHALYLTSKMPPPNKKVPLIPNNGQL
jgi:hypothetical protein